MSDGVGKDTSQKRSIADTQASANKTSNISYSKCLEWLWAPNWRLLTSNDGAKNTSSIKNTSLKTRELKSADEKSDLYAQNVCNETIALSECEQDLQCVKAAVEGTPNIAACNAIANYVSKNAPKQIQNSANDNGTPEQKMVQDVPVFEIRKRYLYLKNKQRKEYSVVYTKYKGLDLYFHVVEGGRDFGAKFRCEFCVDCYGPNPDIKVVRLVTCVLLQICKIEVKDGYFSLKSLGQSTSIGCICLDQSVETKNFVVNKGANGITIEDRASNSITDVQNAGEVKILPSWQLSDIFGRTSCSIAEIDVVLTWFPKFYKQVLKFEITKKTKAILEKRGNADINNNDNTQPISDVERCILRLRNSVELFENVINQDGKSHFLIETIQRCLTHLPSILSNSSDMDDAYIAAATLLHMVDAVVLSNEAVISGKLLSSIFTPVIRDELRDAIFALMSQCCDKRVLGSDGQNLKMPIIKLKNDGNFHHAGTDSSASLSWQGEPLRDFLLNPAKNWWNVPPSDISTKMLQFLCLPGLQLGIVEKYTQFVESLRKASLEGGISTEASQDDDHKNREDNKYLDILLGKGKKNGVLSREFFESYFSDTKNFGFMRTIFDMCHRAVTHTFLENVKVQLSNSQVDVNEDMLSFLLKLNISLEDVLKLPVGKFWDDGDIKKLKNLPLDQLKQGLGIGDQNVSDKEVGKLLLIMQNLTLNQRKAIAGLTEEQRNTLSRVFHTERENFPKQIYDNFIHILSLMLTQKGVQQELVNQNETKACYDGIYKYLSGLIKFDDFRVGPQKAAGKYPGINDVPPSPNEPPTEIVNVGNITVAADKTEDDKVIIEYIEGNKPKTIRCLNAEESQRLYNELGSLFEQKVNLRKANNEKAERIKTDITKLQDLKITFGSLEKIKVSESGPTVGECIKPYEDFLKWHKGDGKSTATMKDCSGYFIIGTVGDSPVESMFLRQSLPKEQGGPIDCIEAVKTRITLLKTAIEKCMQSGEFLEKAIPCIEQRLRRELSNPTSNGGS
ncbi:MAG: hypothetical protein K2L13_00605 [Opitutales bacterium]|nr:hypothetical protein [Opitutales bacterium]